MKSEWKVASNYFGGDKPFYQVYRKIDVDAKIDHFTRSRSSRISKSCRSSSAADIGTMTAARRKGKR